MRLIVVVKKNVIKEDLRVKRPFFKNNEKYCTADISALVPYFSPHATYLNNMLRNLDPSKNICNEITMFLFNLQLLLDHELPWVKGGHC